MIQWIGLFAGPVLALAAYLLLPERYTGPEGQEVLFTPAARATMAVLVWMATWWLTEALDVSATALLPLAVFPLLGVLPIEHAAAPYASELIFLFLGGFILALSMQRWGLDRRIALITLRLVGTKPANMIAGFMLVTAVLSMWVSNTATTAMMLPIALRVIDLVARRGAGAAGQSGDRPAARGPGSGDPKRNTSRLGTPPFAEQRGPRGRGPHQSQSIAIGEPHEPARETNFALSIMLAIAYAASIGGLGTIIGSPPNGILVEFLRREHGIDISFAGWMMIGLPLVAVFLPLAWAIITWVLYPIGIKRIKGGRELIQREFENLGPMKRGEWITMIVFFCTAGLWMFRPLLMRIQIGDVQPFGGLSDGGIAILAAMALFVIPVQPRRGEFTMNWATAKTLPWGILILFGGGLSLAAGVQANEVGGFFGAHARMLHGLPPVLLVLAVAAGMNLLTQVTSNTAATATLLPVLVGLAPGLGVPFEMLVFPATLAASCAFMMPVATPPNAIVFSSGYITIRQMASAGLWMSLLGIGLVTIVMYTIIGPLVLRLG